MKATVRLDHELLAVEGEHTVHAMLELVAPAPESDIERAPIAVALVIDRSGSMCSPCTGPRSVATVRVSFTSSRSLLAPGALIVSV